MFSLLSCKLAVILCLFVIYALFPLYHKWLFFIYECVVICCSFEVHQMALGMHFNTQFHLRISCSRNCIHKWKRNSPFMQRLTKKKKTCNCVSFRYAHSTSTWILLHRYSKTQWDRKLSWKETHSLRLFAALWCVKLCAKFSVVKTCLCNVDDDNSTPYGSIV